MKTSVIFNDINTFVSKWSNDKINMHWNILDLQAQCFHSFWSDQSRLKEGLKAQEIQQGLFKWVAKNKFVIVQTSGRWKWSVLQSLLGKSSLQKVKNITKASKGSARIVLKMVSEHTASHSRRVNNFVDQTLSLHPLLHMHILSPPATLFYQQAFTFSTVLFCAPLWCTSAHAVNTKSCSWHPSLRCGCAQNKRSTYPHWPGLQRWCLYR